MNLQELGWDDFFSASKPLEPDYVPARIIRKHNFGYDVANMNGQFPARIRGRLRQKLSKEAWPAIGDWVYCSLQLDYLMIEQLIPRKSKISRKVAGKTSEEQVIAANADIIFLVISLFEDFNPRKLERYIALAVESGAKPVIILNKVDMIEDKEYFIKETEKLVQDIPILMTNALDPDSLNVLSEFIGHSKTVVFLGSSGVGKSTIVNALLKEDRQSIKSLNKHNKGKHTTTSRDMFFLEGGGILIDNPGIRELRVWLDSDETLSDSFVDIEQLSQKCRFRDCSHISEPGCAVLEAVELNNIDVERVENWRRLQEEALELLVKRQEFGRDVDKKQSHRIARFIKHNKKSDRTNLR
ncbi:MAG: ribosome small subunit-dependent GTPase A [Brevinemataceae bacterium]